MTIPTIFFKSVIPTSAPTETFIESFAEVAGKIAHHNFEWRFITLVFFNSSLYFGVQVFSKTYPKSLMVGNGTFDSTYAQTTRQYIIFAINLDNIIYMLEWMRQKQFDNTGRFIVSCTSDKQINCDETKAIHIFWKYRIVNVIFLRAVQNVSIVGFTYYAYSDERCNIGDPVEIHDIASCLFNETRCYDMFPLKLRNLHLCSLAVSTFVQSPYMSLKDGVPGGIDGDIVKLLAEGLNGTLRMMTPRLGFSWGTAQADGNWTGSFGDIFNEWANVSMASAALTKSRYTNFQMSVDYNFKLLVWVTPPATLVPSSMKLLHPFRPIAFSLLALSFIFIMFFAWILKSTLGLRMSETIGVDKPRNVVLNSWAICMGLPLGRLPRKPALLHIVLFWIWYCFLIRTLYQSSLVASLKSDIYNKELETFEEILDEGYAYGGVKSLKEFYVDFPTVRKNWVELNVSDFVPTMKNISMGMKFALALNILVPLKFQKQKQGKVHILQYKMASSPIVVFFKKFSPLAEPINFVLRRVVESGLTDKIYKNHMDFRIINEVHSRDSINLEDYTGCYVIIIVGWFLSIVCFMIELLLGNKNKGKIVVNLNNIST